MEGKLKLWTSELRPTKTINDMNREMGMEFDTYIHFLYFINKKSIYYYCINAWFALWGF